MIKAYFAFDERYPIVELSRQPLEYHEPEQMFIDEELFNEFVAVEKAYYALQRKVKKLIQEQRG